MWLDDWHISATTATLNPTPVQSQLGRPVAEDSSLLKPVASSGANAKAVFADGNRSYVFFGEVVVRPDQLSEAVCFGTESEVALTLPSPTDPALATTVVFKVATGSCHVRPQTSTSLTGPSRGRKGM